MSMIIPRAKQMIRKGDSFLVPLSLSLSLDEYAEKAAKCLTLFLPQCSVFVTENGIIRASRDETLKGEAYRIDTEQGIVRINYADYTGLRNALATLAQLVWLEGDKLVMPSVRLEDAPVLYHRGVMLDIARGVKKFEQFCADMVLMAKARMNVLHIHLGDETGLGICLDSLPNAMRLPGAYAKEQVKQLLELADVLGLEVIPEYDMPGHSISLLKALPELGCSVEGNEDTSPWVVCAGKEAVFELFQQVIAEICQLFPGKYFHMGGDELEFADDPQLNRICHWDMCPDCQSRMEEEGLTDRSELYYYFVKRIHSMVSAQGKRLVMWSEQMDGDKEELLPEDILMQFWRIAMPQRGPVHSCSMAEQLERGYQVLNSYYPETYIDLEYYMSEDSIRTWRWDLRPECDPKHADRIIGSELCCWEYGNEAGYPHYWTSLPSGIFMMADKLWNGDELPDSEEYSQALTKAVLGCGIPKGFNLWPCFGGRIPPRTNKMNVYEESVTATDEEKKYVLEVLAEEQYFAANDFGRACAYKKRLESAPA